MKESGKISTILGEIGIFEKNLKKSKGIWENLKEFEGIWERLENSEKIGGNLWEPERISKSLEKSGRT